MRAYEILREHDFPEIKQKSVWRVPNNYEKDKNSPTHVGSGAFSSAHVDKDSGAEITKHSRPMSSLDGYIAFLEALSKNKKMQNNPYFPRFSEIELYKSKLFPSKSYTVKMEPLHKTYTLSTSEKAMLIRHMFTDEYISFAVQKKLKFHSMIVYAIYSELYEAIKDDNFKKAAKFINDTSDSLPYILDLNTGNIMIRRGPFMPQIVITDPLGSEII